MTTIDLSQPMAVHIIGVGGAGMRAIASVLAAMGHRVTGSEIIVTLWRVTNREDAVAFDRKRNVGLHHLAFRVSSFEARPDEVPILDPVMCDETASTK